MNKENVDFDEIVLHCTKKVGGTLTHNKEVGIEIFEQIDRHIKSGKCVRLRFFSLWLESIERNGNRVIHYRIKPFKKRRRLAQK